MTLIIGTRIITAAEERNKMLNVIEEEENMSRSLSETELDNRLNLQDTLLCQQFEIASLRERLVNMMRVFQEHKQYVNTEIGALSTTLNSKLSNLNFNVINNISK